MTRRTLLLIGLVAFAAIPTVAALWLAGASDDAEIIVFAPSSLAPLRADLDEALAAEGLDRVEWVFAGSQSLVAQLVDGAPADALITADRPTFDSADEAGVTWPASTSIASNGLVLAVADGNPGAVDGLDALADDDRVIGVCAPEVPCGRLTAAVTTALGVTPRPDTEEASARGLTAKLAAGEIDAALVYRSDARTNDLQVVEVVGIGDLVNEYWGTGNSRGIEIVEFLATGAGHRILIEAGWTS